MEIAAVPEIASALDVAPSFALALPFYAALVCYAAALAGCFACPRLGAWLLGFGFVLHLGATLGRGWAIGFFPLTNKMESFSGAALALAAVTRITWREIPLYTAPLLALLCAAMISALSFSRDLSFPPPLMRTLWYPLHVPLSFFAYATWAAAAAATVWFRNRDPAWLARIDRLALNGFALWSFSMICESTSSTCTPRCRPVTVRLPSFASSATVRAWRITS